LIVNVMLFQLIREAISGKYRVKVITATLILFAAPFIISWFEIDHLPASDNVAKASYNVIIVQPNIDPYNEKFDINSFSSQLGMMISLSEKQLDTNTVLVIWPETALSIAIRQDEIEKSPLYKPVFDFVNRHPQLTLLTGIETFKVYGSDKATPSAQLDKNSGIYYDDLNAAVSIKSGAPLLFYTKGKLVPGVETLPDFLKWMAPVFEQFGGTAGGYAHSDSSSVFAEPGEPFITAPLICYESIYGEYVSTYVQKGANLLTIITNDGWWKNTPGHQQHLHYACLRAIETRRYVARSANTGISAVINEKGQILESQPWDKASYIKTNIPMLTNITFYVKWGDMISKAALIMCLLLIVFHLYLQLKNMERRLLQKRRSI
ncbi:MAG: apolipoprotein N-acyltransferase, partial [Sediminibacterium sp.]